MQIYDDKDVCKKCGKKLESHMISYTDFHDGGMFEYTYKEVDRNFAHKVGIDFYCNDCYDNIGNSATSEIVHEAINFLNNELKEAFYDVEQHYENKINQLNQVKKYIENGIKILNDKNKLSDLSDEELLYLLSTSYIHQPNYQDIRIGFCKYKLCSEVSELFKIRKD